MAILSDTNILSSFAAADALHLLPKLFLGDTLYIPPAVEQELQMGLDYGKTYLEHIFLALQLGDIQVLHLTKAERSSMVSLPAKLHAGEREGIVLCQTRSHFFLSNDRRAIRYCHTHSIDALSLEILLRLLWTRQIISQNEVKVLIKVMTTVENLILSQKQWAIIFAPHP